VTLDELERGDRVWYRPVVPGYGYDRDIPAIVDRLTAARVRIVFNSHGGTGSRIVDIATKPSRLRPRHATDAAPIDTVWASLHSAVLREWDTLDREDG